MRATLIAAASSLALAGCTTTSFDQTSAGVIIAAAQAYATISAALGEAET
jgi:hypothetical protein